MVGYAAKDFEGITLGRHTVDDGDASSNLDDSPRVGPDEGVAGDSLAALDALQKEGIASVFRQLLEHGERRHDVRRQPARHRHDVEASGQFHELVSRRSEIHVFSLRPRGRGSV